MSNDEIFGIINFINSLSFSEFELDTGEIKIRIQRDSAGNAQKQTSKSSRVGSQAATVPVMAGPSIKAPITGVFYRASAPGEEPFVSVGDAVKKGDILCILEAMKMMNEVKSDRDGVIKEILVTDGNTVDEQDVLFAF